jgi:hypothetical protein
MSRKIVADGEDAARRTRNVVKTFRRIERAALAAAPRIVVTVPVQIMGP